MFADHNKAPTVIKTITRTRTDTANLTLMAIMTVTLTMLLGIFSAQAAALTASLVDKLAFKYQSYNFLNIGEYGTLYNLTDKWQTVKFGRAYGQTPVVIVEPLTQFNGQPAHVRLKNITDSSFEVKVEEWAYLDGSHRAEHVNFLIIPAGSYEFGSFQVDVGRLDGVNQTWQAVSYKKPFSVTSPSAVLPIVLSQSQTLNDVTPIVTRNKNVTTTGFEVRIQEEERQDGQHSNELVGYIAFSPFAGNIGNIVMDVGLVKDFKESWKTITFRKFFDQTPVFLADSQTANDIDTAALRQRSLTGRSVQVMVEEEQSKDREIRHSNENVGYIVLSRPKQLVGRVDVYDAGDIASKKVIAGARGLELIHLTLDTSQSDVGLNINSLKELVQYHYNNSTTTTSTATMVDNFAVLADGNPICSATLFEDHGDQTATLTFDFSASPIKLAAGTQKTLTVVGDVSPLAIGTYQVGPSAGLGQSVVAASLDPDVIGTVAVNVAPSDGSVMEFITHGGLAVSATATNSVLPQNTLNANVGTLSLQAIDEDISVEGISIAANFPPGGGASGYQTSAVSVYDGSTLLGKTQGLHAGGIIDLRTNPLIIPVGQTKVLNIKADTSCIGSGCPNLANDPFVFNVSPYLLYGVSSAVRIYPTGQSILGPFTLAVVNPGVLTINIAPGAPTGGLMATNTTVELKRLRLTATNEDILVQEINLCLQDGGENNLSEVGEPSDLTEWRVYNAASSTAPLFTGAVCVGQNCRRFKIAPDALAVPKNSSMGVTLIIKTVTANIGVNQPGTSGADFKVGVGGSGGIKGVGFDSWTVAKNSYIASTSSAFKLHLAYPVININTGAVTRESDLVPGSVIFDFTVSNPTSQPLTLHRLSFLTATTTGDLDVTAAKVRTQWAGIDISDPESGQPVWYNGHGGRAFTFNLNDGFGSGSDSYLIAPASSLRLQLIALNVYGADAIDDESITTSILGDNAIYLPSSQVGIVNSANFYQPFAGGNFVWSDLWLNDAWSTNATSSPQWWNGYLVRGLTSQSTCGNGQREFLEQCDDGNNVSGDGCNYICRLETPPTCSDTDVTPQHPDGRNYSIQGTLIMGEVRLQDQCFDANSLEEGYCINSRSGATEVVHCNYGCSNGACNPAPTCGNGVIEPGEQCDDSNAVSGDGCSASCQIEVACFDSDNGDNIATKGYRINYTPGYEDFGRQSWDYCIYDPVIQSGGSVVDNLSKKVASCQGSLCYVIEYHCVADRSDAHRGYPCPGGCTDGSCAVGDLSVSVISLSHDQPVVGQQVSIYINIKNNGSTNLTSMQGIGNVFRNFQDFVFTGDATPLPSPIVDATHPLLPGEQTVYTFFGSFSSSGDKTLTFTVDNANELPESDETNNTKSVVVNVKPSSVTPLFGFACGDYSQTKVSSHRLYAGFVNGPGKIVSAALLPNYSSCFDIHTVCNSGWQNDCNTFCQGNITYNQGQSCHYYLQLSDPSGASKCVLKVGYDNNGTTGYKFFESYPGTSGYGDYVREIAEPPAVPPQPSCVQGPTTFGGGICADINWSTYPDDPGGACQYGSMGSCTWVGDSLQDPNGHCVDNCNSLEDYDSCINASNGQNWCIPQTN